ncbi:MAG: hypothetical protein ACRDYB_07150 [Acidimicrobiales bacterium]
MAVDASVKRTAAVVAGMSRFADGQGLGDPPLSHLLIEAYCARGLALRTSATKGTYRSVLRQQVGPVLPVGRPRYPGAPAKAPYPAAERAELVAVCRAQPRAWRGEAALMVLALGAGAGLRSGEIAAARGGDVATCEGRVVVSVGGDRARTVSVEEPFAEVAMAAARRVGEDHLFHPGEADRRYHNFVNAPCTTLVADPGAVRLSVARCRASYVCDRLEDATPLGDVLAATGIGEVESLLRYARFVPGAPHTKAGLRRVLREGR